MKDPHVDKLHYEMIIAEHTDYDKAPPIKQETDDFIISTEGKSVIFTMKKHFANELDARNLADDYLKKWEVLIGIHGSPDEIKFRFKNADIIDRSPPLDGSTTVNAKTLRLVVTGMNATLHVSRHKYPDLPNKFKLSPDVEMLYSRYKLYKKGSEPLPGMAYWCLKLLQTSAGGSQDKASNQYNISSNVLKQFSKLASRKGDEREARKIEFGQPLIPLKPIEKAWIEAVIKAIIIRLGEYAYDPNAKFKKLIMSDFPKLPD